MSQKIVNAAGLVLLFVILGIGLSGCAHAQKGSTSNMPVAPTAVSVFGASPTEPSTGLRFDAPADLSKMRSALGSLPVPHEELWIIERAMKLGAQPGSGRSLDGNDSIFLPTDDGTSTASTRPGTPASVPIPGTGALMARLSRDPKPVPIPLQHTSVQASISGYIATVDVTQQYHNPYSEKIEAIYVFPLPHNAAVNEFLMTIGTAASAASSASARRPSASTRKPRAMATSRRC